MRGINAPNKRTCQNGKLVVFADLDLTLFDQTQAREKAYSQAISALDLGIPKKKALSLGKSVEGHWRVYELMGLPNFKLLWNSPKLYEVIVALVAIGYSKRLAFQKELKKVEKRLSSIETRRRTKTELQRLEHREIEKFGEKPETIAFKETFWRVENDQTVQAKIKKACEEFENSTKQLTPFEDVKDFIRAMDRLGIDLYVVSEGEPSVQLDKIRKLGLGELIKNRRVFIVREKTKASFLEIIRSIKAEHNDSMKVAVVGDRYDKDVAPVIELLKGNVITIRLLYGKYKNEYTNDVLEKMGLPKPTAIVHSIGQAKRLLMKPSLWKRVKEISLG